MEYIIAKQDYNLIVTKRAISWLIDNTCVCVFNPVTFSGYQRQIDRKHCERIVNYLLKDSFLPTAIVCSNRDIVGDKLWIVDGQHRVEAFRILRETNEERFNMIKDVEVPVIILDNVPAVKEIETFITINKTSKKVDTSLAFVLKNRISREGEDMAMSKAEYISVEIARKLCVEGWSELWTGKILFEGNVKMSSEYISLNAFVRATRIFINLMHKKGVINYHWDSTKDVEATIDLAAQLVDYIWIQVKIKWPELFSSTDDERRIIQGSIGYTAITRTLIKLMKEAKIFDIDTFRTEVRSMVMSFRGSYVKWMSKGIYSKYSSESGYKIVSEELIG